MCPLLAAFNAAYRQSVLINRPNDDMSDGECNMNVRLSFFDAEVLLLAGVLSLGIVVAMVGMVMTRLFA